MTTTHTRHHHTVTVQPAESCRVGPTLRSQWRNGQHWHAVWPQCWDNHWCYRTREEAQARADEVNAIWRDYPHLSRCPD
jgi:hypothetical protein